jgi:hypothetical protein
MRGLAVAEAGVGVLRRPLAQGPRRVLKQLPAGADAHHRFSGTLRGAGGPGGRGPRLANVELAEVLLRAPIYCGVPVANTPFRSRSACLRPLTWG